MELQHPSIFLQAATYLGVFQRCCLQHRVGGVAGQHLQQQLVSSATQPQLLQTLCNRLLGGAAVLLKALCGIDDLQDMGIGIGRTSIVGPVGGGGGGGGGVTSEAIAAGQDTQRKGVTQGATLGSVGQTVAEGLLVQAGCGSVLLVTGLM